MTLKDFTRAFPNLYWDAAEKDRNSVGALEDLEVVVKGYDSLSKMYLEFREFVKRNSAYSHFYYIPPTELSMFRRYWSAAQILVVLFGLYGPTDSWCSKSKCSLPKTLVDGVIGVKGWYHPNGASSKYKDLSSMLRLPMSGYMKPNYGFPGINTEAYGIYKVASAKEAKLLEDIYALPKATAYLKKAYGNAVVELMKSHAYPDVLILKLKGSQTALVTPENLLKAVQGCTTNGFDANELEWLIFQDSKADDFQGDI